MEKSYCLEATQLENKTISKKLKLTQTVLKKS